MGFILPSTLLLRHRLDERDLRDSLGVISWHPAFQIVLQRVRKKTWVNRWLQKLHLYIQAFVVGYTMYIDI